MLSLARDLYETKKRVIGPKDPSTLHSLETLAHLEGENGSIAKGTEYNYQHYQACLDVFGKDHLRTLNGWYLFCRALFRERRYLETETHAKQIVAAYKNFPNNKTDHGISALQYWADSVYRLGRFEEAKEIYEKLQSEAQPHQQVYRADAVIGVARSLASLGKPQEAIEWVEEQFKLPTGDPEEAISMVQHQLDAARAYLDWDLSRAEAHARKALGLAEGDEQREECQFLLGDILFEAKKYDGAIELLETLRGDDSNTNALLEMDYGLCLNALGRDGNRFLDRATAMARQNRSSHDGNLAIILRANGLAQSTLGNTDKAALLLKQARQIFEHTKGPQSEEVVKLDKKLAELSL